MREFTPQMRVWRPISDARAGYLFSLSDSLRIVEDENPSLLVRVSEGAMIVASDYSGQHKEATHEAYSFVITTDQTLKQWLPSLKMFRQHWLPDDRRISFKRLGDRVRWRALPAFLRMAGDLSGNLVTILVSRRVGSFFPGGPDAAMEVFPSCFPAKASRGTVEKMLRLASFVALILSGLRREDQDSLWISDHDEALDGHEKREQFARLATYLTFGVTGWTQAANHEFGTTELPSAPYWAEDVAAIADLAAGAYCQMSAHLPAYFGAESWQARVDSNSVENQGARAIGNWLATGGCSLKHVLLRLEPDAAGRIGASAQAFIDRSKLSRD